jgi:mannose-6-phosphate isomerase-like protein (cupin superfamily)
VFVKNLNDCSEYTANDGCRIRELLHPEQDVVELPYSLAVARVEAGKATYKHRLKQTEIYFILNGSGRMHIDDETTDVGKGDVVLIPAEAIQRIDNTGSGVLEFAAIVSPPWNKDDDIRLD